MIVENAEDLWTMEIMDQIYCDAILIYFPVI
jgi:hypothetical protein